jgi:hypothetical protein
MRGWADTDERSLLDEAVRVLRDAEPVPTAVMAQARGAFAWRNLSAAIAELEFDSAVDNDDLARVRGRNEERRLSFRGPDLTVELSVTDGGRRLVGNITPVRAATIELRNPQRTQTTSVDDRGSFLFERIPRGSVSLRCTMAGGEARDIETEWVTL